MRDSAYRYQADIQWVYATGGYGSIFDDQPTVILLILSGCFEFFQVAGLYRNRWRFSMEYTQSRSENGCEDY